jgi:hypothetical protein
MEFNSGAPNRILSNRGRAYLEIWLRGRKFKDSSSLSLVQLSAPILVAYTPIINEEADFYPLNALVHAGTMYKLRMFRAQQNHPIGSNGVCSDTRADVQAQNVLNSIRLLNEDKRLSPHILTGEVTLINEQRKSQLLSYPDNARSLQVKPNSEKQSALLF